jgi:hypothetical protein
VPKRVEPEEKAEHGLAKRALGAVEAGVDNLLAQKIPQPLNKVQIVT